MPLSFAGIYKLSDVNQSFVKAPQIAIAPRKVKVKDPDSGKTREDYQFLVANDVSLGHTISGEVGADDEGQFEIEDDERRGNDGKPVLWRFEPLTLKLWNEMGENDEISGWNELKSSIKDDADLLNFYRQEWLSPSLEWWNEESTEAPKAPEAPEEPKPPEVEAPTE